MLHIIGLLLTLGLLVCGVLTVLLVHPLPGILVIALSAVFNAVMCLDY
jgi:hypothetical protein